MSQPKKPRIGWTPVITGMVVTKLEIGPCVGEWVVTCPNSPAVEHRIAMGEVDADAVPPTGWGTDADVKFTFTLDMPDEAKRPTSLRLTFTAPIGIALSLSLSLSFAIFGGFPCPFLVKTMHNPPPHLFPFSVPKRYPQLSPPHGHSFLNTPPPRDDGRCQAAVEGI